MMVRIELDPYRNSINTIRIIAAIEVLYLHTIAHLGIEMPSWITYSISFFYGVPVFLMLSGFLIWMSIGRSQNFIQYLKKRFWRIYPELWAAVLIELLVLIILYENPIDWIKLMIFAVSQSTIFQFWTPEFLRDYGCGTPNGSLWTICVLIQFYFFAYYIFKLMHARKLTTWLLIISCCVILSYCTPLVCSYLPMIVGKLYTLTLLPYLWMFLIGAFISEYKNHILPLLIKYWYILLTIVVLLMITKIDLYLNYRFFRSCFLFGGLLGFSYKFPALKIKTDVSYGIYIYHMTVVNALLSLGLFGYNWLVIVVLLISYIISFVSAKSMNWLNKRVKIKGN